jgi:signal transduction histidine kinase
MLRENDQLHQVAHRSIYTDDDKEERILRISRLAHVQAAFTDRSPVIIANTEEDERWLALPGITSIRSWMGVPLLTGEEVIGLLNVSTSQPDFYTERDARLTMMFANQSAVAIQNARLYAQSQAYAARLEQRVEERTRELSEAYQRLQELDRLKSKLIDDISHELRTPVASLNLYLDLLVQGKEERRSHYIQVLRQQMRRLEEMMEGIIQVSQLELMRGQVSFTAVSLAQIIRDVVASQRQRAEALALRLEFSSTPDLPSIWGDASLLSEMSKHLVENAINYTESGEIRVRAAPSPCGRCVYLLVRDTGIGIAAADLPHLFDRFYRGEGASQSNRPGVGLGLTVVREIVSLHRGDIDVTSRPGAGTTFVVRLPVKRETAVFGCAPPA